MLMIDNNYITNNKDFLKEDDSSSSTVSFQNLLEKTGHPLIIVQLFF